MSLRHLFGSHTPDEPAARPPSAEMNETDTVRRIVAQLETLPLDQRRFIAGFAYVLGRTAEADLSVSADEVALMERTVMDVSGLSEAQAVLVVEIARSQAELFGQTEDFLVTREFARTASQEDRERLLRCAFSVGAADGSITSPESAEINEIGKELGFTPGEVDGIRTEFRDQLSAVQAVRRAATAEAGSATQGA